MDFHSLSSDELHSLAISLFDELGKRQLQVKILDRLSNEGLKNLGLKILEELGKRYIASTPADKVIWDAAFVKFVEGGFPDLVQAFKQKTQLLRLAEQMLEYEQNRNPKPRNTERDDEIVRLHDDERKSFSEIGRLLILKNRAWHGRDGKQLKYKAVQRAYLRRKKTET